MEKKTVSLRAVVAMCVATGLVFLAGVFAAHAWPGRAGVEARSFFTVAGTLSGVPAGGLRTLRLTFHKRGGADCSATASGEDLRYDAPNFSAQVDYEACGRGYFDGSDVSFDVAVNDTAILGPDGGFQVNPVPYAQFASVAAGATGPLATQIDELVPPGTIAAFGGTSAPRGWLLCDGLAISRVEYSRLFRILGIAWGAGDGIVTFNVPDLRGRFLRGVSGDTGRDPDRGRSVGSVQDGQVGPHSHAVVDPGHSHGISVHAGGGGSDWIPAAAMAGGARQPASPVISSSVTRISVSNSTGQETRPMNSAVNYIVKY